MKYNAIIKSFIYDDSLAIEPVSKYDFVPEIVLSKEKPSGEFFMWVNAEIPKKVEK